MLCCTGPRKGKPAPSCQDWTHLPQVLLGRSVESIAHEILRKEPSEQLHPVKIHSLLFKRCVSITDPEIMEQILPVTPCRPASEIPYTSIFQACQSLLLHPPTKLNEGLIQWSAQIAQRVLFQSAASGVPSTLYEAVDHFLHPLKPQIAKGYPSAVRLQPELVALTASLSHLLHHLTQRLAHHPQDQIRLRRSINEGPWMVNRARQPEELEEMTELNSYVWETLRLHPPISVQVEPTPEDLSLNGESLAPNSQTLFWHALSQKDPSRWEDPESFNTRRDFHRSPWYPFGTRGHSREGQNLILHAARAFLFHLLPYFKLEFITCRDVRLIPLIAS